MANLFEHPSELMLTENGPFRVCIGIGYGKLLTGAAYEYADPDLVKLFKRSSLSIAGVDATYFRHKLES